ncbi:MAG: hypothetical protein AAB456_04180 [Patescibacteria group bacterium]
MNNQDQKILQQHLARFLIKDVFNLVTEDDILKIRNKVWKHRDRELTDGEIKNLKEEADYIGKTQIWKFLIAELKWHIQRKAILESKTSEDLVSINATAYLIRLIETFFENLK